MPAVDADVRRYEAQRERDERVRDAVVAFTHFMHATPEQAQQALDYLDGEGDENTLIHHLFVKLARDKISTRDQLEILRNMKRKSLGARRAASILSAATPR